MCKIKCHEAAKCFPCDAIINGCFNKLQELEERIEFAIEYLPESPDKAMQFLTPALDKKEKGKHGN